MALLSREDGHALRSDSGKVEGQKAGAIKMPLECVFVSSVAAATVAEPRRVTPLDVAGIISRAKP